MAQTRKVGRHATTICTENGVTRITYHNTPVVTFGSEGVILNHGGWRTQTTKNRMNQASCQFGLDYHVFQKDGDWYVEYNGGIIPFGERTLTLKRR